MLRKSYINIIAAHTPVPCLIRKPVAIVLVVQAKRVFNHRGMISFAYAILLLQNNRNAKVFCLTWNKFNTAMVKCVPSDVVACFSITALCVQCYVAYYHEIHIYDNFLLIIPYILVQHVIKYRCYLFIEAEWRIYAYIYIRIYTFSFNKMHLKLSPGKWEPFCLGLNVLMQEMAMYKKYTKGSHGCLCQ